MKLNAFAAGMNLLAAAVNFWCAFLADDSSRWVYAATGLIFTASASVFALIAVEEARRIKADRELEQRMQRRLEHWA